MDCWDKIFASISVTLILFSISFAKIEIMEHIDKKVKEVNYNKPEVTILQSNIQNE